jgi:hypothetical protein
MGLFDLFDSDERRWRQEARDEAKRYRSEARDYMADAKSHHDDFKEYQRDARRESSYLSGEMKEHVEYKVSVLNELGSEVDQTMKDFKTFKIEVRVPAKIKIATNVTSDFLRKASTGMSIGAIAGPSLPSIFNLASVLSDPFEEKDRAMDEMFKAQSYCFEMESAAIEMQGIRDQLGAVRRDIRDERICIEQMMGKLRKTMDLLKHAMQKDSFTEEEVEYFNGIYKIAGMIKNSIEQPILDDQGYRSSAYVKYSKRIQELNNALPSQPSLSERSWLSILASYDV